MCGQACALLQAVKHLMCGCRLLQPGSGEDNCALGKPPELVIGPEFWARVLGPQTVSTQAGVVKRGSVCAGCCGRAVVRRQRGL